MKHTHKNVALNIALLAALPSVLMAILILTATGTPHDEAIGATVRLTALNDVASGNMPIRSAAPETSSTAKSPSSRSRRIVPAVKTGTVSSPASAYEPVSGERTVDVSGGEVPYNFERHTRDTVSPDVIFRLNAKSTGIDMAVYEDPNFKRAYARISYSNGLFADVTRDICFDAVRQMTMVKMDVNAFSTLCLETAEGRLIKVDLHPSLSLTARYVVLDTRAAPPRMPSGPEAAEGVIELLGNAANYDPDTGTYSYKGSSALFLEKRDDQGGEGPHIEVNIPETMFMTSMSKTLSEVTEKDCKDSYVFYSKIGSKSNMAYLRDKGDTILCLRFANGRFAAVSDADVAAGSVKIRFLRQDTDRGPGTGEFSLDKWEAYNKENSIYTNASAYYDFSHRIARDDNPFDMAFSGDSRTLRFEAAWNSGKPVTAFAFPWTNYSQTTADVCAKAFADGFGSRKIAIGDADATVCFLTGDSYTGKMKRRSSAERAIAFEIWKKTAELPAGATAKFSEDGLRDMSIPAGQFMAYKASSDKTGAIEKEISNFDILLAPGENAGFLTVAGTDDGKVRLAQTDEDKDPTYEVCQKALTTKAEDPYAAGIRLNDSKGFACFETLDGFVGAVRISSVNTDTKKIGIKLFTWRKPSAPPTPGVVRIKPSVASSSSSSQSSLAKTILLNIYRVGEKGDKGREYKYNGSDLNIMLFLKPDGTVDKQVTKERCNRIFKRGWKKKCWNETSTVKTEAFTLSSFAPLEKLVPITGVTYDALTQDMCRSLVSKQRTALKIEKVSADTVACIAEPGGRIGKVGAFNGSTMTIFLW